MIISHKHEFIFIKTRKTAGSSIEHYLSKYLGPNDICTGSLIDGTPRLNAPHHKGHIDHTWVAKKFPNEWRTYYKFAVDRNPWDKMISYYNWHKPQCSFEDYCLEDTQQYNCWFRYADDVVRVDRLMKYEDLHDEIKSSPLPYADEMFAIYKKQELNKHGVIHTPKTVLAVQSAFNDLIQHFNYCIS